MNNYQIERLLTEINGIESSLDLLVSIMTMILICQMIKVLYKILGFIK